MKAPEAPVTAGPPAAPLDVLAGRHRRAFQAALLAWYAVVARPLRIRTTRAPWPVLVAEVMAQQTQIARVDEAWSGFLERFPTPASLAEATPADALRAWSGLGYNRRAVNLQRAARLLVAEHGGQVPGDVAQLEALPGIGPYTARAVAALAFGRPVAAVDTNVRRVLGRVLGRALPAKQLQAVADALVAIQDPGGWTHASMELGATVCRATRPDCPACPVSRWCASAGQATPATAGAREPRRPEAVPRRVRKATAQSTPGGRSRDPVFEQTTRWLRGRIVAHLRAADDGAWVELPDRLGSHGPEHIAAAATALQRDGLLERGPGGAVRLPSTAP
jgi:A/G-specific adenine glycosylase